MGELYRKTRVSRGYTWAADSSKPWQGKEDCERAGGDLHGLKKGLPPPFSKHIHPGSASCSPSSNTLASGDNEQQDRKDQ